MVYNNNQVKQVRKKEKRKMPITQEIVEQLMKEYKSPEDLLGESGLLKQLTKALVERAMKGEMTHHLGYEKGEKSLATNKRNGTYPKKIISKEGEIKIEVARDRESTYEPQIVKKGQSRFNGFDDKVISQYARGMTTREIQGHLEEIYGIEVSPSLISQVTDEVIEEVRSWQNRPLEEIYPILYLDALIVKVKMEGRVTNKAVYLAVGVNTKGFKEVLGMWIAETEGAKFWLQIVTEIKNRGVKDIFIACVDGLKGLPEAIESVFPKTQIQQCIVHLIRNSLNYVPSKDRKAVAADLRQVYSSTTAEEAEMNLEIFESTWGDKYPLIARSWRANWARVIPFFAYPEDIRRAIYTTNSIESINFSLRKIIKNKERCQINCVSKNCYLTNKGTLESKMIAN
jgi:putative transposase